MTADHIDYVLYDRSFTPGIFTNQTLYLPAVQLNPSFVMNEHAFKLVARQITEDKRPSPSWWATFGDFPREWLEKHPLLYISQGTAFNDRVDFYRMCFDAFAGSEWQVVLSFGTRIDPAALKEPPANFLIAPHVPQLEVLSRADLFISHGGMNSTMESLSSGVPLVVVPQMIEQEMNARRVQDLGLGITLEKETLTVEQLRASVEQITQDASLSTRMQAMQQEIRRAGGYRRAVDEIIRSTQNV